MAGMHNAAMATRLVFLVPGFFGFTSVVAVGAHIVSSPPRLPPDAPTVGPCPATPDSGS
jgi:hypothetical protein